MSGASQARAVGAGITAASLLAIGLATLLPNRNPTASQSCCGTPDFVLNLILFIPLGIGLSRLGFSGLGAALAGAALSTGIELSQLWLIPGRDSALHDVVSNCLGTAAGALVAQYWAVRRDWWRWVGGALVGLFLLFALGGPWLVLPVYPERSGWYSQWQHDFRGMATFPGRILSFSIQNTELPDGDVANHRELRAALVESDSVEARLRFETGLPVEGKAQVAGLVAGWPGPWILNFVQERTDLLVSTRFRMSDLGFSSPVFRLRRQLPETAGDTIGVVASWSRKSLRIAVMDSSISESRFSLSTDLAWVAFLPARELSQSTEPWIRGAASFLALSVLGVGAGRSWLIKSVGFLCWLVAGPLLFGLSVAGPLVVGLGVLGLVAGAWLSRVLGLT